MSLVEKLTEGLKNPNLQREGARLLRKWEQTGLLEGLDTERKRSNMAVLLENQAKQILKEATTMAGGDVEGFAQVAFPIVRRVFGATIAEELVSVQPMSLPSGLIFFLDFTYTNNRLAGQVAGESVYGQGRVASQITGGVLLDALNVEKSQYNLNNGYSLPTGTLSSSVTLTPEASGTVGAGDDALDRLVNYDPDLSGSIVAVASLPVSALREDGKIVNERDYVALTLASSSVALPAVTAGDAVQVRRLTRRDPDDDTKLLVALQVLDTAALTDGADAMGALTAANELQAPLADNFQTGGALGTVVGADVWGLEGEANIPEIDLKVDSVAITAITRKLKAKWTPELGQDLNAYHNMDAEVELTSILSEHIEIEINAEILEDLVKGATAAVRFWSRRPGKFVDRETGADVSAGTAPPDFTGNVSEWYQTFIEAINDVSAVMQRKLRRDGASFIVIGPELANVLEFTQGFAASITVGQEKGSVGATSVGSINNKLDVYVDPNFFRNIVLVGRKGSSFLESGYVYAPYVPMQMTPTIFGPEDFVPRKGVMTRYGKKMVRPDMYGLVYVLDMRN